jgi:predicted  nucleic acid-binding Zn-ribbon protein
MSKVKAGDSKEVKFADVSIEERLIALARLQSIDSQIDKIRIIRGELPLEVQDLEDDVQGLKTRIDKLNSDIEEIQNGIREKEEILAEGASLIKKYEDQRMNVRNNREYDSLTKEIEYQSLEIQIAEKRIKEFRSAIDMKNEVINQAKEKLADRNADLELKKNKLAEIISETERDEADLNKKSKESEAFIEPRLLSAYKRIRGNARNGYAVVPIDRDACGGCFNKIPPQRQLDIRMHKKIIVCEYCGRILIDKEIIEAASAE